MTDLYKRLFDRIKSINYINIQMTYKAMDIHMMRNKSIGMKINNSYYAFYILNDNKIQIGITPNYTDITIKRYTFTEEDLKFEDDASFVLEHGRLIDNKHLSLIVEVLENI